MKMMEMIHFQIYIYIYIYTTPKPSEIHTLSEPLTLYLFPSLKEIVPYLTGPGACMCYVLEYWCFTWAGMPLQW